MIWESTRACPLACVHCRATAQPDRHSGELSTDEATELMRQIASFGKPSPLFIITGGDPFQRPDLFELVRRADELGLHPAVSPSGTPTLTEENLTKLHEAGARAISLSIDGSTAEVHDAFRRVDGVFDWTVGAWQTARRVGLKVQVNTTVYRGNLRDLPNIVKMVQSYGAMTWSGFLLVPTGRGSQLDSLTPAEVEDVLNFIYDAGDYIPSKTTEGHHFRRVVLQRRAIAERGGDPAAELGLGDLYQELTADLRRAFEGVPTRPRRPPMNINSARGFVFISHVGTVHPSGFLPMEAGNVRDQPLPTIYRESELFRSLRDPAQYKGKCGRCEFNAVCGGSRSRAYALTGDPLESDPWCAYQPADVG